MTYLDDDLIYVSIRLKLMMTIQERNNDCVIEDDDSAYVMTFGCQQVSSYARVFLVAFKLASTMGPYVLIVVLNG